MPGSTDSEEDVGRMAAFGQDVKEKWTDFRKFLWDPTNKTVLGRGGKSWGRILIFYMFYYSFLAALFAASISIVLSTLSKDIPRFQTRLQTPGMSIQPRQNSRQALSSDIKYTVGDARSTNILVDQYEKFLYPYAAVNQTKGVNCTNKKPGNPKTFTGDNINTPCYFDKDSLGPCAVRPYGYNTGKPCILVKVNKIINWFPIGFTNLDNAVAASDSKAPPLRDVLNVRGVMYDPLIMYVACYGRKEADMVNLNGDLNQVSSATAYYPQNGGIEFKYYPYYGNNRDPNYRVPLVAVQFNNVTRGQDINVGCKVYARNIIDDMRMRVGYYSFVMRID